jgi:hypothetical protein
MPVAALLPIVQGCHLTKGIFRRAPFQHEGIKPDTGYIACPIADVTDIAFRISGRPCELPALAPIGPVYEGTAWSTYSKHEFSVTLLKLLLPSHSLLPKPEVSTTERFASDC